MVSAAVDYEKEQVLVYTEGQQTLFDIGKPSTPKRFMGFKEIDKDGNVLITFDEGGGTMIVSKTEWQLIEAKIEELCRYQGR